MLEQAFEVVEIQGWYGTKVMRAAKTEEST